MVVLGVPRRGLPHWRAVGVQLLVALLLPVGLVVLGLVSRRPVAVCWAVVLGVLGHASGRAAVRRVAALTSVRGLHLLVRRRSELRLGGLPVDVGADVQAGLNVRCPSWVDGFHEEPGVFFEGES